jgi:hypothetical protein
MAPGFVIKWLDNIQHMLSAYSVIFICGWHLVYQYIPNIGYREHILHFHIGQSVVFIGPEVDDIRYAVVFWGRSGHLCTASVPSATPAVFYQMWSQMRSALYTKYCRVWQWGLMCALNVQSGKWALGVLNGFISIKNHPKGGGGESCWRGRFIMSVWSYMCCCYWFLSRETD